MNIEQRLQSARCAIIGYNARLAELESGVVVAQVGELIGTRRLLARKQRQLRALEVTRTVLKNGARVTVH